MCYNWCCGWLISTSGVWNNLIDANNFVTYGPSFLWILLLPHKLFTSCSRCFATKQSLKNVLFALGIQFPFQESSTSIGWTWCIFTRGICTFYNLTDNTSEVSLSLSCHRIFDKVLSVRIQAIYNIQYWHSHVFPITCRMKKKCSLVQINH